MTALRNLAGIRGLDRDFIYLLQFTMKHDLEPIGLHASMLAARDHGNSRCGKVSIKMRRRRAASSTYMFSVEGEPVAQANIRNDSVEMLRNPDEFHAALMPVKHARTQTNASGESRISNLKLGLKGVCFKAVVVKKSDVRAVTSRDGVPLLVCSVTLSDGTGEIPLAVWNNQIATISKGDRVQVRDARVRSFRGEIQLSLSRKTGELTVLESGMKPPIAGNFSHRIAT